MKAAKRFVCPLALREITNDLAVVVGQPSRMASSSIRVGEREAGMANFIIRDGYLPCPLGLGI